MCIKINNRKLLLGICESLNLQDAFTTITVVVDKLDKIGHDKVIEELIGAGIVQEKAAKLMALFTQTGDMHTKLDALRAQLSESETGMHGVTEIEKLWEYFLLFDFDAKIELDLSLARGLDYYTGAIFEVKALDAEMGSICGGGRYDDLTGIFGLEDMSGVGVSFGADRIYDVLLQKDAFPGEGMAQSVLLFVNFGEKEAEWCLPVLQELRKAGIPSELYPDMVKMKKQMKYADRKDIPWVAIVGSEEMKSGKITLKNMREGSQESLFPQDIIDKLKG